MVLAKRANFPLKAHHSYNLMQFRFSSISIRVLFVNSSMPSEVKSSILFIRSQFWEHNKWAIAVDVSRKRQHYEGVYIACPYRQLRLLEKRQGYNRISATFSLKIILGLAHCFFLEAVLCQDIHRRYEAREDADVSFER